MLVSKQILIGASIQERSETRQSKRGSFHQPLQDVDRPRRTLFWTLQQSNNVKKFSAFSMGNGVIQELCSAAQALGMANAGTPLQTR